MCVGGALFRVGDRGNRRREEREEGRKDEWWKDRGKKEGLKGRR